MLDIYLEDLISEEYIIEKYEGIKLNVKQIKFLKKLYLVVEMYINSDGNKTGYDISELTGIPVKSVYRYLNDSVNIDILFGDGTSMLVNNYLNVNQFHGRQEGVKKAIKESKYNK